MSKRTKEHWQNRYRDGDMPWDTGEVTAELCRVVMAIDLRVGDHVLDIGCGTGTDACWLASSGFITLGIDVAANAVALARAKAGQAALTNVQFLETNILDDQIVEPCSYNFAYDRGCFHAVDEAERSVFAGEVARRLHPGGHWLSICGNAAERRAEGEHGPPQLTAGQIVHAVEAHFDIVCLERGFACDAEGKEHLSWTCLMTRRDPGV